MRNTTNYAVPGYDACIVPDCGLELRSKRTCYCRGHHQRFIWFGSLSDEVSTILRFGRHLQLDDNGCWNWTGSVKPNGYGQFHVTGGAANTYAHRASWELHRGEIPEGMTIDHLCRNIKCVNPEHLEPVPNLINQRRRWEAMKARTHGPHMVEVGWGRVTEDEWLEETSRLTEPA